MEGRERDTPSGSRFPRAARIRSGTEIRTLIRRGKRRRTKHLDVFFSASPVSRPRWGVVVPKHRRDIVDRNRLRRRLREVGRTVVLPRLWTEDVPVDVLVRARSEAYDAAYADLEGEISRVTEALCSDPSSWR